MYKLSSTQLLIPMSTSNLQKFILSLGVCLLAINILTGSILPAYAQDPTTPITPGMGIPSNITTVQTTNNNVPAVPVPKAEVVKDGDMIITKSGVVTQDFKNTTDTPSATPKGATNELKATDLTIQKSITNQAKNGVEAVRTGAVPVFLLIAAPIGVMLWYQYRFIRTRKTSLATTEEKITNSTRFDKK